MAQKVAQSGAKNKTDSAGFLTEVAIQKVDLLFLEFLVQRGIDAQRDVDIFVAHLIAGGHDVHTGKVHQGAEGVAQLVRGEGVDDHRQAAGAIFALLAIVTVLDVEVLHIALPQAFPALLGHALALAVVQHIQAAVLLGLEVVHKELGNADDACAGGGFGALGSFAGKIVPLGDCDGGLLQIDVRPRQCGGLAAAQTGVEQQHGRTLGGVGRFTDPALLLVGDGCADLWRSTGRTGGFCDGVIQDHLGNGKIIGGLSTAA